ncbi:MAG TPA: hypothetical protein VF892_10740, partial [Pseudonocardiaceae bacterium]
MRHRASDLNPAFDTATYGRVFDSAGYGGGFDVAAGIADLPGGFEAYARPATEPAPSRGRPFAVAGTAAVALLGAALVITGATQSMHGDSLTGLPLPQSGPHMIATHQAGTGSRHDTQSSGTATTTTPAATT